MSSAAVVIGALRVNLEACMLFVHHRFIFLMLFCIISTTSVHKLLHIYVIFFSKIKD